MKSCYFGQILISENAQRVFLYKNSYYGRLAMRDINLVQRILNLCQLHAYKFSIKKLDHIDHFLSKKY